MDSGFQGTTTYLAGVINALPAAAAQPSTPYAQQAAPDAAHVLPQEPKPRTLPPDQKERRIDADTSVVRPESTRASHRTVLQSPILPAMTQSIDPKPWARPTSFVTDDLKLDGPVGFASSPQGTTREAPGAMPVTQQPEAARNAVQQIHTAIIKAEGKMVEIALKPEELGKVKISMSQVEGVMSVSIIADRPETLDLLRRNIDMLNRDFEQMGFDDVSFDFEAASDASTDEQAPDGADTQGEGVSYMSDASLPPAPLETATQGVDIRI